MSEYQTIEFIVFFILYTGSHALLYYYINIVGHMLTFYLLMHGVFLLAKRQGPPFIFFHFRWQKNFVKLNKFSVAQNSQLLCDILVQTTHLIDKPKF